MFRGKESSNRIELSQLVQELLKFGVLGSLWLWGGAWLVGGVWGCGGVPTCMHRHAHTCMHIYTCIEIARSLSLFANPERILRRFYVFAEEPCKSTITTSEPCSPVFKEAQPRPSSTQKYNISHTNILNLYLHVFLLLVI